MATVTFLNESYECATALKGADYIHLLDRDGKMIAAFDGIASFSGFSIAGGSWTTPADQSECYLAVVREDGTVAQSGHKCCDVLTTNGDHVINGTLTATKIIGAVYA